MDWNEIVRHSQEAFRVAVNEWISKAKIRGGSVRGSAAVLTPGSLTSDVHIESRMTHHLAGAHVHQEIATGISKVLAHAWSEWAAGFQMHIPNAYPPLAAVPARMAPPTPSAGAHSLSMGTSHGEAALKTPMLASKLTSTLSAHASHVSGGSAETAMTTLANWVDSSFSEWKSGVKLTGLIGKGPAPTFAPPYVPVAPVLGGENMSAPVLLTGARFGKVIV